MKPDLRRECVLQNEEEREREREREEYMKPDRLLRATLCHATLEIASRSHDLV